MQTVGQRVALAVFASINNGKSDITNPQSWPNSATFGVEYNVHDRQFPQVKHEPTIVYFDNVAELLQWFANKRDWVEGTDYDFSVDYAVYVWDWGPVFKYRKSM